MNRLTFVLSLVGLGHILIGLSAQGPAPVNSASGQIPAVTLGLPQPTTANYPINLATALKLAGAQPLAIALAEERVKAAAAQFDRAKLQWLPNLYLGADYARHDGPIQQVLGDVTPTSRSSFFAGGGAALLLSLSDAWFEPLAARQRLNAQRAGVQTARNDILLDVGEAYFQVQQARGELAGADDALRRTEELVRRTEKLSVGLIAPVEVSRVKTELARRRQAVSLAKERWAVASAELTRVLRLEGGVLVEPQEPPHLQIELVPADRDAVEYIDRAMANRPELDQHRALLQATYERYRQEKIRPLVPSLLVRGASANPSGTFGAGVFGGGLNSSLRNFGARSDWDVQMIWELQNLGLGNRARIQERRSENQQANLELYRLQDSIVADVVKAVAQVKSAAQRIPDAEQGLKDAIDSAEKNFEGLAQTRRAGGDVILLVVRPQEAVASVQALQQAYVDYFVAINDYDRAQFRLYRAIGSPGSNNCSLAEIPLHSSSRSQGE